MNDSRRIRYDKRRLPRQKRTIKIFGATCYDRTGRAVKDESNAIYKCWYCGFIINEMLHPGIKPGNGIGYIVSEKTEARSWINIGQSADEFPLTNDTRDVNIVVGTNRNVMLAAESGVLPQHSNYQKVVSGCPGCGCQNYR